MGTGKRTGGDSPGERSNTSLGVVAMAIGATNMQHDVSADGARRLEGSRGGDGRVAKPTFMLCSDTPSLDVTAPRDGVEIIIRHDGKVVWVNVDGVCAFRASCIPSLAIEDRRECCMTSVRIVGDDDFEGLVLRDER